MNRQKIKRDFFAKDFFNKNKKQGFFGWNLNFRWYGGKLTLEVIFMKTLKCAVCFLFAYILTSVVSIGSFIVAIILLADPVGYDFFIFASFVGLCCSMLFFQLFFDLLRSGNQNSVIIKLKKGGE